MSQFSESHCYRAPIPDIPQHVSHVLQQAIDSHFHLDRTVGKYGIFIHWQPQKTFSAYSPPGPKRPVNVIGAVEIYCDPSFYPPVPSSDCPFKVAVDIYLDMQHPFLTLTSRLKHISTWCEQERILIEVLILCTIRKLLILHLRMTIFQVQLTSDVWTLSKYIVHRPIRYMLYMNSRTSS